MKLPSLHQLFSKTYETQVITLVAALGNFRLLIALALDVRNFNLPEILTDFAIFIFFAGLLVLVYRKANIRSVHPLFGIVLTILLAINFVQFGGISGSSRFNFFCGICIVILLYAKQNLMLNLVFMGAIIMLLCAHTYYPMEWMSSLFIGTRIDPTNFIFSIASIGLFSFYLKSFTIREITRYDYLNGQLQGNVSKAREQNKGLVDLAQRLLGAQKHLEREIFRKTSELEEKNRAIENYIKINTEVLQEPVTSLKKAIVELPKDSLGLMAQGAAIELEIVYRQIKARLEEEQQKQQSTS